MIKTYVLILVFAHSYNSMTSTSVEFVDAASCIKAMRVIQQDLQSERNKDNSARLVSYGCYPLSSGE